MKRKREEREEEMGRLGGGIYRRHCDMADLMGTERAKL